MKNRARFLTVAPSRFFIVVLLLISISFTGCFLKRSGESSNPVGPALNLKPTDLNPWTMVATAPIDIASQTTPVASSTIVATETLPIPEGTCTVSFVIAGLGYSPNVRTSIRSSVVSASLSVPTASATLFVDGIVAQRKSAPVVNGSVTLTFTGVQDSGTARLDLELIGCSVSGVTFFTGTSQITQNTVIVLSPSYPAGSNRTSDGKLLVEIGSDDLGRIAFNDLGQPIGFATDRWVTNYETGEKLLDLRTVDYESGINTEDLAYLNGLFYFGGGSTLSTFNPTTKEWKMYGSPQLPVPTFNGDRLDSATFKTISDLQVSNSSLFIHGNYRQIIELKDGILSVQESSVTHENFCVTETGETLVMNMYDESGRPNVSRWNGGSPVAIGAQNDKGQYSMIAYRDGYLISRPEDIVYFDGTTTTTWLTPSMIDAPYFGAFFIYKNQVGQIYVCNEGSNKIWKLQ